MDPTETFDDLATLDLNGPPGSQAGVFPILAFRADHEGEFGNGLGFKLYFDRNFQDEDINDAIGSLLLRFEPLLENPLTQSNSPIRDIDNASIHDISLKQNAFFESTQTYYDFDRTVERKYTRTHNGVPENTLLMSFGIHHENLQKIIGHIQTAGLAADADAGAVARAEFESLSNGYLIDMFTGMDILNQEYETLKIVGNLFNKSHVKLLKSGSDGLVSDEMLNALTASYLNQETTPFPQLEDEARYPITHLYDSGYDLPTKREFINFMSVRRDVNVDLCCQDVTLLPNDADVDQSVGATLRTSARLHPESVFFGTEVMRCSIYQQTGSFVSDQNVKFKVPVLLDRMIKRCRHESTRKVTGLPVGLPAASVDIFSDISWTPSSTTRRRRSWSTGLNYVQYYDSNRVHFPDYRSVHPFDNSVLSDGIAVDHLVYVTHIARFVWAAFYTGQRQSSERLYDRIRTEIDKRIFDALDGRVETRTTIFQTAQDQANGYSDTLSIAINFPSVRRVLNVEIPVGRLA